MDQHITTANLLETGADELGRFALEECVKRHRLEREVSVLLTPAGRCGLAIKFARLGARVSIADREEMQQEVAGRALAAGFADNIAFIPSPSILDTCSLDGSRFDIIFLRRGLCSLPYDEARTVVRLLMQKLKIGGKLYTSVFGLHSELGHEYPGAELPIDQRYQPLASKVAAKYELHDPLCLYTERNLFTLLLEAGASVLRTLTTTYGNVQGIAVRV